MKKLIQHFATIKLIVITGLLLGCIAATGLAQSAEENYRVRVDIIGVPGEGVGGSIEAIQFNSSLASDLSTATGASSGRAKFAPIVITKGIDSATPKLQIVCAGGQRLAQVQISLIRSSRMFKNGEQVFLRIVLDDVQVASVNTRLPKLSSADGSLSSSEPSEDVAFTFSRITWIYIMSNGSTIKESWDLRSNREM